MKLEGSNIDPDSIFDESADGTWLAVGNTWPRENDVDFGFKIKKTVAETNLSSGRRIDIGGIHYMFTVGFDF